MSDCRNKESHVFVRESNYVNAVVPNNVEQGPASRQSSESKEIAARKNGAFVDESEISCSDVLTNKFTEDKQQKISNISDSDIIPTQKDDFSAFEQIKMPIENFEEGENMELKSSDASSISAQETNTDLLPHVSGENKHSINDATTAKNANMVSKTLVCEVVESQNNEEKDEMFKIDPVHMSIVECDSKNTKECLDGKITGSDDVSGILVPTNDSKSITDNEAVIKNQQVRNYEELDRTADVEQIAENKSSFRNKMCEAKNTVHPNERINADDTLSNTLPSENTSEEIKQQKAINEQLENANGGTGYPVESDGATNESHLADSEPKIIDASVGRGKTIMSDNERNQETEQSCSDETIQTNNKTNTESKPIKEMEFKSDLCPEKKMFYDYHRLMKDDEYENVHEALRAWSSDEEYPTDNTPRKDNELVKCVLCSYLTMRRCEMANHIKTYHINQRKTPKSKRAPPKMKTCPYCDYTSTWVLHVVLHQVIYHPEQRYGLQFYTKHWNKPPFRSLYYKLRQSKTLTGKTDLPPDPFADSCMPFLDDVPNGVKVANVKITDMLDATESVLTKLVSRTVSEYLTSKRKCDSYHILKSPVNPDYLQMFELERWACYSSSKVVKRVGNTENSIKNKNSYYEAPYSNDVMLLFEEMLKKLFCWFCLEGLSNGLSDVDYCKYGSFRNVRAVADHIFGHMNLRVYLCWDQGCDEWCAFPSKKTLLSHVADIQRNNALQKQYDELNKKRKSGENSFRRHQNANLPKTAKRPNPTRLQVTSTASCSGNTHLLKTDTNIQGNSVSEPGKPPDIEVLLTVNPDRSDDSQSFEESRFNFYLYLSACKNSNTTCIAAVRNSNLYSTGYVNCPSASTVVPLAQQFALVQVVPLVPLIPIIPTTVIPVNVIETSLPICKTPNISGRETDTPNGRIGCSPPVPVIQTSEINVSPPEEELPSTVEFQPPDMNGSSTTIDALNISTEASLSASAEVPSSGLDLGVPSAYIQTEAPNNDNGTATSNSVSGLIHETGRHDASNSGLNDVSSPVISQSLKSFRPQKKCFRSSYRNQITVTFNDYLSFEELQLLFYSDSELREKVLARKALREKQNAKKRHYKSSKEITKISSDNQILRKRRHSGSSRKSSESDYSDDPNDPYYRIDKNDSLYLPHVMVPVKQKDYLLRNRNKKHRIDTESFQTEGTGYMLVESDNHGKENTEETIHEIGGDSEADFNDNTLCLEYGDASYAIDLSFPRDELMLGESSGDEEKTDDIKRESERYTIKNLAKNYAHFQPIKDENMEDLKCFGDCGVKIESEASTTPCTETKKETESEESITLEAKDGDESEAITIPCAEDEEAAKVKTLPNRKRRKQTARKSITPWNQIKSLSSLSENTDYTQNSQHKLSLKSKNLKLCVEKEKINCSSNVQDIDSKTVVLNKEVEIRSESEHFETSKSRCKRKMHKTKSKVRFSKSSLQIDSESITFSPLPAVLKPLPSPGRPIVERAIPSPGHPVVAPVSPASFSNCPIQLQNNEYPSPQHHIVSRTTSCVTNESVSVTNSSQIQHIGQKMKDSNRSPYKARSRDSKQMSASAFKEPFSPNAPQVSAVSLGITNRNMESVTETTTLQTNLDDIRQPFSPNAPQVRPVVSSPITESSVIPLLSQLKENNRKHFTDLKSTMNSQIMNQPMSSSSSVSMAPCPVTSWNYKKCEYCNKRFQNLLCAKIHYWVDHQQLSYNRDMVIPHSRATQLDMENMVCPYCRIQILGDHRDVFEYHILTHLQMLPYICQNCQFPAVCPKILMKHSCFSQRMEPLKQEQKEHQKLIFGQKHCHQPSSSSCEIKDEIKPTVTLCHGLEECKGQIKTEPYLNS